MFMGGVLLGMMMMLLGMVQAMYPPPQDPPCFGPQGHSLRGIDVAYNGYTGSFTTSTHSSYWNYTEEVSHMRYDVIGSCDVSKANSSDPCPGGFYSQTNLFYYEMGISWTWLWPTNGDPFADGFNCTAQSAPTTSFECIPADFKPISFVNIAGVNCTVWSSPDGTQQQVATNDPDLPVLVQVINRDENLNIKEFVQIVNYVPYIPNGPGELQIPEFCPDYYSE